jgi:hypothetical protein
MSSSAPSYSSWPQPTLRLRALLVLTVLVGLLGMHGLAHANPVPSGHTGSYAACHMVSADADQPCACHTDDGGGSGRHGSSHADQMCVSGAIPGPAEVPTLAASVPSSIGTAAQLVTLVPYEPAGGLAPPSLAELQLLRI